MHFTVMVIGEDWQDKLAPYQENNMGDCPEEYLVKDEDGYIYNPNSKWDWYQLGGRWQGMLKVKEGALSGVKGERSLLDNRKEPLGIDAAKKIDIDNWDELYTFAFCSDDGWFSKDDFYPPYEPNRTSEQWDEVNKIAEANWRKQFDELKSTVGDDEYVFIVDCHV